jgi:hypothetical protein
MDDGKERVCQVGYINPDMEHVLISIFNPALLNPDRSFVQVAITIESAIALRAELNAFLKAHGVQAN